MSCVRDLLEVWPARVVNKTINHGYDDDDHDDDDNNTNDTCGL